MLTLLSQLAHRAVVSSNVSSASFFRVIEELQPTLLIDETDTFLKGKSELRGILNAGYTKETAFVLRMSNQPSPAKGQEGAERPQNGEAVTGLASYSCWCPKVIARIGRLPSTLADRCIVFRMQRKTSEEPCERSQVVFVTAKAERLFSGELVGRLNGLGERPWHELSRGKAITELWLASQLRPYGIRPKTMWIGPAAAKGYVQADFMETFKRYIPRGEIQALMEEARGAEPVSQPDGA